MARPAKRSRPLATFRHSTRIEVRRPQFRLLAAVRQLDVDRLARAARAEIEVGYYEASCCRQLVKAIVRNGKVTELTGEPCSNGKPGRPHGELLRVLNAAGRRLASDGPPPRLPMPVATFLGSAARITIRWTECVEICIFQGFCFVCCRHAGTNDWSCGREVIIVNTF